jgi:sugar lactone lactonase YvrE
MKVGTGKLLALVVGLCAGNVLADATGAHTDTRTLTGFVMPESAVAHADGRVFLTEIGGFGKNGDGRLTVLRPDGGRETLVDGLNDPKGIDLIDGVLYIADVDRVLRVSLDGQVEVVAKPADFPRKPVFLNDIEIDGAGNVYVSDSGDDHGAGGGIFRIDRKGTVRLVLDEQAGIKRPNGLLMEGADAMLVADFGTGDLFRFVLAAPQGKPLVTRLNSGFGGADGLVRDARGTLYVSDWAGGNVWRLSDPTAAPHLISSGHQSSADIALSADGRHLLMPDMKAGTLVYLPVE